jgi:hypothetical protein
MIESERHTVVAAFKHRAQAQRAVDAMLECGFDATRIRIEGGEEHQFTPIVETAPPAPPPVWAPFWPIPAGAVGGALAGAAVWGAGWTRRVRWRWLRGGFGPALVGLGLGAAGGLALAMLSRADADAMAVPSLDPPAHYDEGSLERGHSRVIVAPGDRIGEAETLLRSFGGRGVHLAGPDAAGAPTFDADATRLMDTVT